MSSVDSVLIVLRLVVAKETYLHFAFLSVGYSIAEELHATELSLPISTGHSAADLARVISALTKLPAA
jgi:dTDP-4-amino-4,6-dideoxygalactose transaminase